jgi:hypothetical protein
MESLSRSIKVGHIDYEIQESPRLKEEGDFARIRFTEAVIEVATPMHPSVTQAEILHEVFHAMLKQAGILPPHPEEVIGALSYSLPQFVEDNPGFFKG